MLCEKCGTDLGSEKTCPNCGCENNIKSDNSKESIKDNGGFFWGLLGCCLPMVGLVLYLVWQDSKPKTAKAAGIGALLSVVFIVLYYIVIFSFGAGVGFGTF